VGQHLLDLVDVQNCRGEGNAAVPGEGRNSGARLTDLKAERDRKGGVRGEAVLACPHARSKTACNLGRADQGLNQPCRIQPLELEG